MSPALDPSLTHQASAPPVLPFAGAWFPYGPVRVEVGLRRGVGSVFDPKLAKAFLEWPVVFDPPGILG